MPSSEESLHMLEMAEEYLTKIGLKRYEISAFAKTGYTSKHNIGYWTARPFFGLGPSAFSYFEGKRFRNIAHLKRYADLLESKQSPIDFEEKLEYPCNLQELLAIELRLFRGVNLQTFQKRHGNLPKNTQDTLEKLCEEGFLHQRKNRILLSPKGRLFYDSVATEII